MQLIIVFVDKKPTSTTNLEEELELTDLPEVVVCMDPGFNNSVLEKYGYNINYFWKGISFVSGEKFVGWNGDKDYNKSSHEILEEALLFPKRQGHLSQAVYFENLDDFREAPVSFRMLMAPYGRCMVVSPLSQEKENVGDFKPNTLSVIFSNATANQLRLSSANLRIFFMDKKKLTKI